MVEPLLGHHLEEEALQLLHAGQRLHLEGAAAAVDQVLLGCRRRRSAARQTPVAALLQLEAEPPGEDLEPVGGGGLVVEEHGQLLDGLEDGDELADELGGGGAGEEAVFGLDSLIPEALLEDLDPLPLQLGALLCRPRLVAVAGRGEELEQDLDEAGAVQLEGGDVALVGEDVGEFVQGGHHALFPAIVVRAGELECICGAKIELC